MKSKQKQLRQDEQRRMNQATDRTFCERCEKDCDEVFECEICGQMICEKCQATYNQFSQIDYNCCESCAKYNNEY